MTTSTTLPSDPAVGAAAPARRIPWLVLAILTVLIVLGGAGGYWYFVGRFVQSTDDAYVGGDVTVIAPRVSGFVGELLVHDNQYVTANQVLLRLDSRDYDARLAQADATVVSARAAVVELQAKIALQGSLIGEQQAELRGAAADLTRTSEDQTRYRQLIKDDAVSDQLVERADADAEKAHAAVDRRHASVLAAQRELDVLQAQTADAQAHVVQAEAEQRAAQLNVGYTVIRSPIDGYIGNRSAQVGLLAATGSALLTVIPAQGLWVDANFKEDQIKGMQVGDRVEVRLDALSDPIQGTVDSIAPATGATFSILPAENATGNFTKIVQRVPVRIRLTVPDSLRGALRPGLSATVDVHLAHGGQRA